VHLLTLDFETFWSKDHSLTKMSPISYVMHPETEIISLSACVGRETPVTVFGEEESLRLLQDCKIDDSLAVAHNMSMFDAMLVAWRLKLKPRMWGCTMAMARPLHGRTIGLSLATLVKHYGIGVKDNTALIQTKGKHLADFTPDEIAAMRTYNGDDTWQCRELFFRLRPSISNDELWTIDSNIRMLVEDEFVLNVPMLQTALKREQAKKRKTLLLLGDTLGFDTDRPEDELAQQVKDELMSGPKFAKLLQSLEVEVPMKPSPKDPKKQIPALAKDDLGFKELVDSDNELVAAAAAARLEMKSTLLETRIEAFLEAGAARGGTLPIPAKYYGAHTGRDSGELYNALNLPRIDRDKDDRVVPKLTNALRLSLGAPKGKVVGVADLSGIEMRVNHTLWKVAYSTALWAADPRADIYKTTAARYYQIAEADVQKPQRQFGKVQQLACLAGDTLVLTDSGYKSIVNVLTSDRVWDGLAWVSHDGLVAKGTQWTVRRHGLAATTNHGILTGRGWRAWSEVHKNHSLFQSALSLATSPSWSGSGKSPTVSGNTGLGCDASVVGKGQSAGITCAPAEPHAATPAPNAPVAITPSGTGSTLTWSRMTNTVVGYLTAFLRPLRAAIRHAVTKTMSVAASPCTHPGARASASFSATSSRSRGGIAPSWIWTGSTMTEDTSPATCGLCPAETTRSTGALSAHCPPGWQNSKRKLPVYDLLNCGPRNRFTVWTDAGPLIVHNCGFQVGAKKFKAFARKYNLHLSDQEAEDGVQGWRSITPEIAAPRTGGWARCQQALQYIEARQEFQIDPWGLTHTCREGIVLPDGRLLRYPDLRRQVNEDNGFEEWLYGRGRHTRYIYGGSMDENIVQALARIVLMDNVREFHRRTGLHTKLRVYDEAVYLFEKSVAEELLEELLSIMRTPPKWWPELVVWSEGDLADCYGLAK